MPVHGRGNRLMGLSAARATAAGIVAGLLLAGSLGAEEPLRVQQEERLVLQQRIIIQPPDGDVNQEMIEQILVNWDQVDGMVQIRQNAQVAGQRGAVWINEVHVLQGRPGAGLTRFSHLDQVQREELTADRVLDLLGWSGMSAAHAEEPLDIEGWANDRILQGLDDPDSGTRQRVTLALALSEHFEDAQLHELLQNKDLTLEQRSRLLDVSFARFVVAPRAAVGASFETGVPIQITGLFDGFPAARDNILRPGDELIEIDGQSLLIPNAFNIVRATVLSRQAGETVPMVIRRPFAPEVVARIEREREEARVARAIEAQAEAEARLAEAQAQALTNEENDPWETDPVWQNIMRQMEILQAKNPDPGMEITPEGDVIFAGQRLGNIAHLDGQFARGRRAIVDEPRERQTIDPEELLTPGETLPIDVPLGSLSQLQQAGRGAGSPGIADLHSAWRYRLGTMGVDLAKITAEPISVRTPDLGWIQSNVGQRVTTLIASPRSARQHMESSAAMNLIQRGVGGRGGWNQANAMLAGQSMPERGAANSQDSTAFRVQSTELAEPEVRMRRHAALNERIIELAGLRDRHATLSRRLRSQPAGVGSESMQRELDTLQRRIDLIEQQLRPSHRR